MCEIPSLLPQAVDRTTRERWIERRNQEYLSLFSVFRFKVAGVGSLGAWDLLLLWLESSRVESTRLSLVIDTYLIEYGWAEYTIFPID